MKIAKVIGREIYDSRGWPTLQCEIILGNGARVQSSVPSGISRGRYEARELRDGDKRLWGKGVLKARENLEHIIAPELIGKEPNALEMDLKIIELDGTPDKSYLGANATLAASMAVYRAQALVEHLELYELIAYIIGAQSVSLPFPLFNLINGGQHADNNLQIQEIMVLPLGTASFRSSLEVGVLIFHELKNSLHKYGKTTSVGDEGGYASFFTSDKEALDILIETLDKIAYVPENKCAIALDIAASHLYNPTTKKYVWSGRSLSSQELIQEYEHLVTEYPIYSIEDGLSEDDWEGWKSLMEVFDNRIQIVGDDIFATSSLRIMYGIEKHVANAVLIKPNQIGTVTETLQAVQLCKTNNLNTIISHRSGETDDSFIADLAVGTSAGQIKAGGCSRGERLAKYNRLLAIEDSLMLAALDQDQD